MWCPFLLDMTLDDLIDEVISNTSDEYEKCVFFMIRCLSLIAGVMPKVGIQGVSTATKYWVGKSIGQGDLDKARIACWDYLDANSASTNVVEKKFCAVRAVICVLYSKAYYDDNGELLDWFFQMLSTINGDEKALLTDLSDILEEHKKSS